MWLLLFYGNSHKKKLLCLLWTMVRGGIEENSTVDLIIYKIRELITLRSSSEDEINEGWRVIAACKYVPD